MESKIEEVLIHSIGERAHTDKSYDDFVSREEFINRTGIFVSPNYFEYIYDIEFKESGVNADEFIQNYEEKYSTCIQEIPLHGIFKYEATDEEVNCMAEYDEIHDPNVWEIMNSLAGSSKTESDRRNDLTEKYNSIIEKIQKMPDKMKVLVKVLEKLRLQNNIAAGLLQHLALNQVCAAEIIANETLKDIWDISMNQLKMIYGDLEKDLESFKQIEKKGREAQKST